MEGQAVLWSGAAALLGALAGLACALGAPVKLRPLVLTVCIVGAIGLSGWLTPGRLAHITGLETLRGWQWTTSAERSDQRFRDAVAALPDPAGDTIRRLETLAPDVYAAIRRDARRLLRSRADESAFEAAARARVTMEIRRRAPRLGDAEMDAYLGVLARQFDALKDTHGPACAKLAAGRPEALAGVEGLPQAYFEANAQAASILFGAALEGGERLPPAEIERLAAQAIEQVVAEHGEDAAVSVLSAVQRTNAALPPQTCEVYASYLRAIGGFPMPERARFFRAVLAAGAED